jgi:hypothetical protein
MSDVSFTLPTATLITALAAVIAAPIASLVNAWIANRNANRANKASAKAAELLAAESKSTNEKLTDIHALVNSRLTEALAYVHELEILLRDLTGRPIKGEPPIKRRVPKPDPDATF